MNIPRVVNHENLPLLLRALEHEPYFKCGSKLPFKADAWYWMPVILEVATGELAEDGMKTLALVGIRNSYQSEPLTGKEGFNAQGLEGKICVRKPLFNALMNMRDLIPKGRGRIVIPRPN